MATVADLDRPWEFCDPRRDRALCPYTDAGTAKAVDHAVTTLVILRAPMWLGDPGPVISVLVSVAGEADGRLYDAVADARDQGYSWDQVASRLATNVATARRRYASYSRWRRALPVVHPDASDCRSRSSPAFHPGEMVVPVGDGLAQSGFSFLVGGNGGPFVFGSER